ncbi:tetratricopeptide repeat protein [Leptolyngbya boryana CZ1]|uniref:Tetratricopeptide repeat protein n=1 Tax=Leptolyngbya boryana CZ1 TaxID=3060204 RepID=A0AA97AMC8_LEPBY|nr:tetratricopeptide repeat protein [Leptolyngbya boryana]WNZ44092.1 tetratricopeptide repeat protein [Leptolyngbya boryana CZ1]
MKLDRSARIWKVLVLLLLLGGVGESAIIGRMQSAAAQTTQERKAEAEGLLKLGDHQANKNKYRAALENFQKALVLFREVGDRVGEGDALHAIGVASTHLNQYLEALNSYNQALVIRKELRDREGEGRTLGNIGLIYDYLTENTKALEFFSRGLAILREIGDSEGESAVLGNIGNFYYRLSQYPKALNFYNEALIKHRESGNLKGEGNMLSAIGLTYSSLSRYPEALDSYNQALIKRRESGDLQGEGVTLNGIGLIHSYLGQNLEALKFFEQSLRIHRAIGDRKGEAGSLNNIGGVYVELKRTPEAMHFYNLSLIIHREIRDRRGEGRLLNNIGSVLGDLKLHSMALEHFNQALVIQIEIGDREGEYISLNQVGVTYLLLRQYPEALDFLNRSLILAKEIGDREGEGRTLSNIGYLLNVQKQSELAITFLKQSVSIYESIRENIRRLRVEQQKSYTEEIAGVYRGLADILLKQDRVLEAQQVLDLLKVQELENYLRNTRTTNQPLVVLRPEQEILKRYNVLQQGAIAIGKELAELEKLARSSTLTAAQEQRKTQLIQLRQDLNQQFNQFANSPEVKKYLSQLTPTEIEARIPFDELRAAGKTMAKLNAVLFYPAVFDDRIELIITAPNSQPLRRTVKGVGKKELNAAIVEFRKALQDPTIDPKPIAQKLYSWLIKPIEPDLEQAKKQAKVETIIYAPDGQLRYIPLAALHDGQNWLIQSYHINNITAKAIDNLTVRPQAQPRILAGAFGTASKSINVAGQNFSFNGLTFAGKEVEQLSALIPGTRTMFDQGFTPDATIRQMNDFSIVHLATHAALVPQSADQSFILFGNGKIATLKEIEDWTLDNVDLIVLSACETGLGGKFGENGEEVLGLGYQFTKQDKAKAAIASLWQVDDGGTELLMNEFYAALKTGKSKAQSLQQAQIALITQKTSRATDPRSIRVIADRSTLKHTSDHPYYWAPFILIGNGL